MASAPQATTESTSTDKDKYPPSRPYLRSFELEVRLSGLLEMKASIKEIQNEKGEKVLMKPDRKEIFEHEENLIYDVVNHLGVDKNEISGFHRLGKYDKNSTRSRQMLVKFKNSYNVDKLLARASMLKMYEPEHMDEKYKVYISKSLDKEQQLMDQKLLKKRRELIDKENYHPRDISIRNGVLYLNHKPVKVEAWQIDLTTEFRVFCYNIRSLFKDKRRKFFANYLLTKKYNNICLCETWLTDAITAGELFLPDLEREFIDYIDSMGFQQKIG